MGDKLKRSKSKTMSQRVLDRIEKRKQNAAHLLAKRILSVALLALISAFLYFGYTVKHNVPDWANFKVSQAPSENHYYAARNPAGVPKAVYLNGEQWIIVQVSDIPSNIAAETFCSQKVIAYINDENPTELRDNLWHEVFHAGGVCSHGSDSWWNNPEKPKDGNDHPGIYNIGRFMGMFSMANPDFMEWSSGYK